MVAVLHEASGGRGEVDPTSEPPTRPQSQAAGPGNVWRMDNTRPSRGRGFFTAADLAASVPRTSAIGL